MYEKFYGFKEKPFEITPDTRFVYLSEHHREALAHLQYAVREGKGFTVITGEVGTGKTTLVHMLLKNLDGNIRTSYVFNPVMQPNDFFNYVCEDLGLKPDDDRTRRHNLSDLHHFLLDCYTKSERVFLIIDEAQVLDTKLLEEVRLLTNLETSRNKLLHVILLGQPELNKTLADPQFRALKQRITVRYDLGALSAKETKEYIIHRLKRAGTRNISVFDDGAIKAIYKYSKGLPRLINIVCDNALISGFSREQDSIGKPIIQEVIRDLEGPSVSGKKKWPLLIVILTLLLCVGIIGSLFFLDYSAIRKYF
jgi:general secretion pathway protein A